MDRNYFLSYSHRVALLLLLSAVGKLNAKFISVTICNAELQHCVGINTHLQSQRTDASANQSLKGNTSTIKGVKHYEGKAVLHDRILKNNFPVINSKDFLSSLLEDLNPMILYKWTSPNIYNKNLLTVFEKVKKFCINPSKLIDGFKFIIKTPDKLIYTLVK